MSVGEIIRINSAADLEGLDDKLKLMARAALAAGYKVENRILRFQAILFVNDKHFHPLTNWSQCVRLLVDTKSDFAIIDGAVSVHSNFNDHCGTNEHRTPTTDFEYMNQMCEAVVTNVAKGSPF
jgi:hypothetical protein